MYFGSVNRAGLIFEYRYRTVFEIKRIKLNLNCWVARDVLMGRPITHNAYAGWLSGCPHASVRRGGAKRYGVI